MFDYIYCEYPIDAPDGILFQTKDTDSQYLENYKIDKDGSLWHEYKEYEAVMPTEKDQEEKGILAFSGCVKTTLKEWRKCPDFRGEIVFYNDIGGDWFEFSALFDKGKLISIERVIGN